MAASAANLHPSAFVETESCNGPRYTRDQPSRETAGVLLNECTDKYTTGFELPMRNLMGYIQSMQASWDRISNEDKQLLINDLQQNLPGLCSGGGPGNPPVSAPVSQEMFTDNDLVTFINNIKLIECL